MKRISITSTDHGSVISLQISGHIDSSTASELEREIRKLTDGGIYRIIVDLKQLDFMSSAGLGVLMGAIHRVREARGDIKIARPNQSVRRLIELMGFDRLYELYDSLESAVAAFE